MDFLEIANHRQSCRGYDPDRAVEREKLEAILEAVRLAPSACNAQPYHLTVCRGEPAKAVAKATQGMGMSCLPTSMRGSSRTCWRSLRYDHSMRNGLRRGGCTSRLVPCSSRRSSSRGLMNC